MKKIYAIKGDAGSASTIFESLKKGEGRFGWSYIADADLIRLQKQIDDFGWSTLAKEEQHCYQPFLLDLKAGDYVVYINVPEWGKCTIAEVIGPYFWRNDGEDFNHRFLVDAASILVFDRNDAVVHPSLAARFKLPRRWWGIYDLEQFEDLLRSLKGGGAGTLRSPASNRNFLLIAIRPLLMGMTEQIQRTHPSYDLETLVAEVLRQVPGVLEVRKQGGAGDHGADIVFQYESGLPIPGLERQSTGVVQIKSYEGTHANIQAVRDIERAFDHYPGADFGLIISTASDATEHLEKELQELRDKTGKQISLIIGPDVARFLLSFSRKLLG